MSIDALPSEGRVRFAIAEREDDPYESIKILCDGEIVCEFDLDDAPVEDFNRKQWNMARLIVSAVNAYVAEEQK